VWDLYSTRFIGGIKRGEEITQPTPDDLINHISTQNLTNKKITSLTKQKAITKVKKASLFFTFVVDITLLEDMILASMHKAECFQPIAGQKEN
jgi:hypothetical protein